MLLQTGDKVKYKKCSREGCGSCNQPSSFEAFSKKLWIVKAGYYDGHDQMVTVEPFVEGNSSFHVDDTFGGGTANIYERHLDLIGGMPVDRILNELMESVEAEDEANKRLFEAKRRTKELVADNLKDLLNTGVIKISVDRETMRRLMGRPSNRDVKR